MEENFQQKNETRRSFLKTLVFATMGVTVALFASPVVKYILPKKDKKDENFLADANGNRVVQSDIKENDSFVGLSKYGPIIMIKREGHLRAFSAACTHLGCLVKWVPTEDVFFCPCHAGKFDVNGANISGPPPSPLTAYNVETDGDDHIILKTL